MLVTLCDIFNFLLMKLEYLRDFVEQMAVNDNQKRLIFLLFRNIAEQFSDRKSIEIVKGLVKNIKREIFPRQSSYYR